MTEWKDGIPDDYGYDRYGESPYYDAKDHGLEVLGDAEFGGSWEFETVVVWQDIETGKLFGAADSGCSCPTPFGDLTREGMKPIESTNDLVPLLESICADYEWASEEDTIEGRTATPQWADLLAKVHRALVEK